MAECNYDIGNRKLLAVKLTLEEWRHWLEGATHPFEWALDQALTGFPRSQIKVECLPGKQFIPEQYRLELTTLAHTAVVTGHPGKHRT